MFGKIRNFLERVLAATLLVLLSPILTVITILVMTTMGRPVFFRQLRTGINLREFELFKFRTMTIERFTNEESLSDASRITRLGTFLRSSSLDELPELWNIARGEMAFVGPRPLPVGYIGRYTDEEQRRCEVLPGLTGWSQVNGRNGIGWNKRLEMDVWYVDHQSIWLDVRILFKTSVQVLRRVGVNASSSVTMPELRPAKERYPG